MVLFAVAFALVAISSSQRSGACSTARRSSCPYVVGTAAASSMWWVNSNDQLGVFNQALQATGL